MQPLDDIRRQIQKYCILPGEHEYTAVTLWVAATHLVDCFDYAPRLVIRSAVKRSGKSRLLEIVSEMVRAPLRTSNTTTAYIYRKLRDKETGEHRYHTILLDEADTVFGTKTKADSNEDLRALLNAGFQRGLVVGRTVGNIFEPTEFEVFSMAALAGIGKMPDTVEDRAIVVVMQRRKPGEIVEPYRVSRDKNGLTSLRDAAKAWADEVRDRAKSMLPCVPVEDRAADLWEPLLTVAELAGSHWPKTARHACKALTAKYAEDDAATTDAVQLLADIREVFGDDCRLKSKELCDKLRAQPDSPWCDQDLSPSRLGRKLREFDITTDKVTVNGSRTNYYQRTAFDDAFARFLGADPDVAGRPGQSTAEQDEQPKGEAGHKPDTSRTDELDARSALIALGKAASESGKHWPR